MLNENDALLLVDTNGFSNKFIKYLSDSTQRTIQIHHSDYNAVNILLFKQPLEEQEFKNIIAKYTNEKPNFICIFSDTPNTVDEKILSLSYKIKLELSKESTDPTEQPLRLIAHPSMDAQEIASIIYIFINNTLNAGIDNV